MGRFRFPGRSTFIGGRTPAQGAPPSAVEALPRLARTEECEAPAAQCAVCSLPHNMRASELPRSAVCARGP